MRVLNFIVNWIMILLLPVWGGIFFMLVFTVSLAKKDKNSVQLAKGEASFFGELKDSF